MKKFTLQIGLFTSFIVLIFMQCTSQKKEESKEEKEPIAMMLVWEKMGDDNGILNGYSERPSSVEKAEFSPDEAKIVTVAKGDFSIRLWDAETGEEIWKIYAEAETEAATFTKDGKYIVTGGEDKKIRVIDAQTGDVLKVLPEIASVEGLQISNNGKLLATGNEAGQLKIWDISKELNEWPTQPMHTMVQGFDNSYNGVDRAEQDNEADINQVDWSVDDSFITSASRNKTVKRWSVKDLAKGDSALLNTYTGHPGTIKCGRLSPDNKYIVAGSGQPADGTVIVWDVQSGEAVQTFTYPNLRIIETVEFTPNGDFLFVGGTELQEHGDGRIYVYKTTDLTNENPEPVLIYPTFSQEYLYFSKDGKTLLVSGSDGALRVFDVKYNTNPI